MGDSASLFVIYLSLFNKNQLIMKNLLLLILFVAFTSCSSDDNISNNSPYNPPSWIHGTWGFAQTSSTPENPLYRFSSDNVCQLSQVSSLCWKESVLDFPQLHSGSDSSSDTIYEAKFGSVGGTTITLKFQKASSSKIIWLNSGYSEIELVKLK